MNHRIFNISLAIAFVASWLVIAGYFDKELMQVQQQDSIGFEARKAQAAMKACGPGSASRWIDETTVACIKHVGKAATVARATP